jgi:hypothetical protein
MNKMELFNEFFVMITIYHQLCFTDLVTNVDARSIMGWSLVYINIIYIIVNFGKISINSLKTVYCKLRKTYCIWRNNRTRAKIIKK